MIPYLHNAIFKVNNFLESLPSFWIMRSQRSRRRDKGLLRLLLLSHVADCRGEVPLYIKIEQRKLILVSNTINKTALIHNDLSVTIAYHMHTHA